MTELRDAYRATALMFFLNGALFGSWASRIPAIKERFVLDEAALGMILLCLAAGAVLSFPIAGRWVDNFGAAPVTRCCALAYVLFTPLLGYAPAPILLALVVFLFGAAHGAMDVAMNAWGAEVEKAQLRQRSILPRLHGLFSIGAGVGAAIGALFAKAEITPTLHFLVIASLCGILTLPFTRIVWAAKNQSSAIATNIVKPLRLAWPRGALLAVGLVAFSAAFGEGAMADWSAVYLVEVLQSSPSEAAMGYAAFSFTMVAIRLWGGLFISRYGSNITVLCCGIVAILGALMLVFAPNVWLGWLSMAVLGIGYALIMPLVFSRAATDPLLTPGAAMAAVSTFAYGGMLLGPPVIGFVAQATQLRVALALLAALAVAMIVLSRSFAVKET